MQQNNQPGKTLTNLQIVGMDPSMSNWGLSKGTLSLDPLNLKNSKLLITDLAVVRAALPENKKQVRQSSIDIERAHQIAHGVLDFVSGAQWVFVEVPVGSQSASAMKSYGLVMGILGALLTHGISYFEVLPHESKVATLSKKTGTKEETIHWARGQHPEAPWPTYKQHGEDLLNLGLAEHEADSIAAIYAGVRTKEFQSMLEFIKHQTKEIK